MSTETAAVLAELEAADAEGRTVDLATARTIAGWWHDSQRDPLYAFTSTGHADPSTLAAAEAAWRTAEDHPSAYTADDVAAARALVSYLEAEDLECDGLGTGIGVIGYYECPGCDACEAE